MSFRFANINAFAIKARTFARTQAKVLAFAALLVLLAAADQRFGWSAFLLSDHALGRAQQLAQQNLPAALLCYAAGCAVGSAVLAVPGMVFALVAGALFGPWLGTAACVASCTVGAMGAFLAGRYFLKDSLQPLIRKNKLLTRWLLQPSAHGAVTLLTITRLIPLFPFNLQNFAYGITNVSFGTYSLCTLAFIVPGTALFTFAGAGVTGQASAGLCCAACTGLLAVVLGCSALLKKRFGISGEGKEPTPTPTPTPAPLQNSLNVALCIITRVPVPGKTKTRMMPDLTPAQCAQLHTAILKDACAACLATGGAVFAAYTAEDSPDQLHELLGPRVTLFPQAEGALADKLNAIVEHFQQLGYDGCVICSSDSPEITPELIEQAVSAIRYADAAFAPSPDGGFGLVAARGVVEGLFSLQEYSHSNVLAHTCANLDRAGATYALLQPLHDMDTIADLRWFRSRMLQGGVAHALHTREFVRETLPCTQPRAVSIVVPVYNEAACIDRLQRSLMPLADAAEVIFVDGGSTDGTPLMISSCFRVLQSARGRAAQMNAGARAATGRYVLFLHADTLLPANALAQVQRVMRTHQAGCFGIRFDRRHPVLGLCSVLSNLRVRVRNIAYGDQALFLERGLFLRLGGFPDQPLMEDWEFSQVLKQRGVRIGLTRTRAVTSARRFGGNACSMLRTWALMVWLRRRYLKGALASQIAKEYHDAR